MKDNFSKQSNAYQQFRPSYPPEIFDFIYGHLKTRECAWDCGTGNGQVAVELAKNFQKVIATDISQKQIDNAPKVSNIDYRLVAAEKAEFPPNYFDLITVAQAVHWFEFDVFFSFAKKVLKPNALIALITYNLLKIDPKTDAVIQYLYKDILGKYWDPERKHVHAAYASIPFPFEEIPSPEFSNSYHWNFEQLIGYLNTWSSVQHYIRQNGKNPVDEIKGELEKAWEGADEKKVHFPMTL
ncbi:MAG: class I SAM-dependent methyltransferase, partial [Chitinophagales bacterium]